MSSSRYDTVVPGIKNVVAALCQNVAIPPVEAQNCEQVCDREGGEHGSELFLLTVSQLCYVGVHNPTLERSVAQRLKKPLSKRARRAKLAHVGATISDKYTYIDLRHHMYETLAAMLCGKGGLDGESFTQPYQAAHTLREFMHTHNLEDEKPTTLLVGQAIRCLRIGLFYPKNWSTQVYDVTWEGGREKFFDGGELHHTDMAAWQWLVENT